MAERRFYWLKLPEGFFRQKEIKKLRQIAGGDTYTIDWFIRPNNFPKVLDGNYADRAEPAGSNSNPDYSAPGFDFFGE